MDKTCFVMMPISDQDLYSDGHFKRVYEFIIKPACIKAGFSPVRADDILNTNFIAIDVIKRIINSEMAICDLSTKNPNVFYELGIRQSFNLPVTLIKDSLTERVFDIQGFRDIEYDASLRIDNVEDTVAKIAETLKNTYNTANHEINSLVSLLGVRTAKITNSVEISKDTELILGALDTLGAQLNKIEKNSIPSKQPYSFLTIDENGSTWQQLTSEELVTVNAEDIIEHPKFGKGKILRKEGSSHNPIITVLFEFDGEKKLMLNYIKHIKKLIRQDVAK